MDDRVRGKTIGVPASCVEHFEQGLACSYSFMFNKKIVYARSKLCQKRTALC